MVEGLRDYIAQRQTAGAAPTSINCGIEALSAAFNLAADAGTISIVPKFPSLPERNVRQGFFDRQTFESLVNALADDGLRDYLRFFFWTGSYVLNALVVSMGRGDGPAGQSFEAIGLRAASSPGLISLPSHLHFGRRAPSRAGTLDGRLTTGLFLKKRAERSA